MDPCKKAKFLFMCVLFTLLVVLMLLTGTLEYQNSEVAIAELSSQQLELVKGRSVVLCLTTFGLGAAALVTAISIHEELSKP